MSQPPDQPKRRRRPRPPVGDPLPPNASPEQGAAGRRPARPQAAPGAGPVTPRARGSAREALLAAARAEFDGAGFEHTDTNRIARRAGYAPQTFYRHFADKTAIFVETYERWLADEWKDLEKAHGRGAEEAARVLLAHHAQHREFRRSLRRLTTENAAVRAARAASRRRQIALLDRRPDVASAVSARIAMLLCLERIADAAADGELADLGLAPDDEVALLADVIRRLGRTD